MLRKVRLNQSEEFALDIISQKVAIMVTSMIDGRPHARSIGSEQGGIPAWDDIVIINETGLLEHYQVKQQTTNFSEDTCNKESGRKDTPLDSAMLNLGSWLRTNDPQTTTPPRTFKIILPEGAVKVKKEFTVNQLERLFNKDTTRLTSLEGLCNLISTDTPTKSIVSWLKTWCDFSNEEIVLRAIQNTQIFIIGNQSCIVDQTKELLARYYADVDEVQKRIRSFITDHSTFTSQITPRAVLQELVSFQLPDTKRWTQYQLDGNENWNISGTHDTGSNNIESPSKTVLHLWDSSHQGNLKLDARVHPSNLGNAILRLAFHMRNLSTAHFHNHVAWIEFAKTLVGGTLGANENDLTESNLVASNSPSNSTDVRTLDNSKIIQQEYDELTTQMDDFSWKKVSVLVTQRIRQLPAGELLDEMENRWTSWRMELESSYERRKKLLNSMLSPNAEGKEIVVDMRLGVKTYNLLRDGIFLLLIVSVAMDDSDQGWEIMGQQLAVSTCSLNRWSGPTGNPRRVRKLTNDGIDKLLGQESAKVLILSSVESPPSQVIEQSIADSQGQNNTLATPHHPAILFTNDMRLRRLIEHGDLQNLRKQIREDVQRALQETLSSDPRA